MSFIRDSLLFQRFIRDGIENSVNSHTLMMANGAAMTAAMQVVHKKSFPYIQGSRSFQALSLPKSYLEEFKELRELLEAFLGKYHSLGITYGKLAQEYLTMGSEYHRLGLKTVMTVQYVAGGVFGIVLVGGLLFSVLKLNEWWTRRTETLESLEAYQNLVESFTKTGDVTSAYNHLYLMIDKGFVPVPIVFESLMKTLLVENRVQTANQVLKLMHDNAVFGENSQVVSDVLTSLLLRGKMGTALKRMDRMIENGERPDFDRIMDLLLVDEKKPSNGMCVKLFDYLVSKEEVLNAYRLVNSDLISGGINYQEFADILNANGYHVEAQIVLS